MNTSNITDKKQSFTSDSDRFTSESCRIKPDSVSFMSADLLCIGSVIVDCMLQGLHEASVDSSHLFADSITVNPGGDALNCAVTASKLGLSTSILCGIAGDAASELLLNELVKNHVQTDRIMKGTPDDRSPVTNIFLDSKGERRSVTTPAHRVPFFRPQDMPERLKGARFAAISSLFRPPFDEIKAIRKVFNEIKSCGTTLLSDTKMPNFNRLSLKDLEDILPLIDYITPNETESFYYTGEKEPEKAADVFLSHGISHVIIKLGSEGCYYKDSKESFRCPAFKVDSIDGTGAGDAFLAGLIRALSEGHEAYEAVRFASACGALTTTAFGATSGITGREQVDSFMNEYR